jgi:fructokinase
MKRLTAFGEILFDVYPGMKTLGGAPFNFIYHIKKFTAEGNFISAVGNDDLGREILDFLKSSDISSSYIEIDNNHPTGAAIANLDENGIPHWEIKTNCAYDFIKLSGKIINLVEEDTDCLYFGTLAQRNDTSRETLNILLDKNIKYFCDLNFRQNFYNIDIIKHSLKTAHLLKLNTDELKIVNDQLFKQKFDEIALAKSISDRFDIDIICITLGENGAIIYKNGKFNNYKVIVENVVDTVGAGDAYASILCLGYLNGWEISKINKIASEFASEIVQIKGALPKDDGIYEIYREKIKKWRDTYD